MSSEMSLFGRAKEFLYSFWPVDRHEWGRFLPMAFMMFFILANYTVLRNLKDTLVTNAPGSDADVIPFIKLFATLPAAILFMLFFTRISSVFTRERVFYIIIVPFLLFFGLYGMLIYPNVDVLHPGIETVRAWRQAYPNFEWFIVMCANWSYSLFYVLAELWGSAILSLLFFQLANELTKTEMAKRFYPLFGFIGNLGLVVSGTLTKGFTDQIKESGNAATAMNDVLNILMPLIVVSGLVIIFLYWYMNRLSERPDFELPQRKKSKKPKLGIGESIKYLLGSRHLIYMAMMVFAYGITINFIDVLWKGQVKELMSISYPGAGKEQLKVAYLGYMAEFSRTTGLMALPLMLLGGFILRHLSWLQAAIVTPIILAFAGISFFGTVYYGYYTGTATETFLLLGETTTLVGLAAAFGYWLNALTKATKYSLFDATKEMAYFPLDDELRSKGKAAVDVVGGRAGKSGGSLTLSGLKVMLPGIALPGLSPQLFVIFFIILIGWFVAVFGLNRSYLKLRGEK